ncbi:MAG TPA: hypothetical protein VGE01_08985 [Fimbriimonas sp.]
MGEEPRYEVVYDPQANRRIALDGIKRNRSAWVTTWFFWSLGLSAAVGFLLYTGTFHNRSKDQPFLIGMALAIGTLLPFVYLWEYARKGIERGNAAHEGKRWICSLTPESWTFTDQDGVATSIPWRLMKIDVETPDAWFVKYGASEVLVYRQPLRDAGLEEEFRSRIKSE